MQIEVYHMSTSDDHVTIELEAVCDDFSSLLWDVQYYGCGNFEVYIAASERNAKIFQTGKIVGRDDDKQHYGIIESVTLETSAENGDYLTVTGRFLMSILSRRIIYPMMSFSSLTSYGDIVRTAVQRNCMEPGSRLIPGLKIGEVSGACWEKEATLQISYENLMEWIYTICDSIGGTANIRLYETNAGSGSYEMLFDLSTGVDRSISQDDNPHVVFSDAYNNLLTFTYASDQSSISNFAYVFGTGEGADRTRATCYSGSEPSEMERYEVYVDARDISPDSENEDGEKVTLTSTEYGAVLRERGAETFSGASESVESEIVTDSLQYQYNVDYFVGDYVTVESKSFGLRQSRIQLTGMIESFDQNGKGLTPTFRTDSVSDGYGTSDSGNPSIPSASGDSGHTHDNKDVLDTITGDKIQKWDSASTVTVTTKQTTGTKIATITVDETTYDVYAPQVPSQDQIDAWTAAAEQAHTHAS